MEQRRLRPFTLTIFSGLFTKVLLAALVIHAVGAFAVYRWDLPCSGSKKSFMSTYFISISNKVPQIKRQISALMNKFEVKRFGNSDHADMLKGYTLPGLLSLDLSKVTNLDVSKTLQDFYQQLSHIAVFLHEAHKDEEADEYEGGYSLDFEKIQENTYWLLCKLKLTMQSRNIPYDRVVTPAVMSNRLRNLEGAKRHNRDYILIRDYGKVLDYIRRVFAILAERSELIMLLMNEIL